ncbi:Holliday junction ATP-dependent DNA helicase RuvB [Spirochaetota bacterium]|nr:Holliday junction ATP-dependent DNA helicase RuvB [Spirochaetota bacterium]
MIDRIFQGEEDTEDKTFTLRPKTFSEFIGQTSVKDNMSVFIKAAKSRKEPLDHVLLSGPPGLGKTTFATIIAQEMNANLKTTSAPSIERSGDMASLLSSLKPRDILFIDEIHRLRPVIEEVLYPALEDFRLDINIGLKGQAKAVRIALPPFTLIGATTKAGSLTQPLISRFGITHRFDFYTHQELILITNRNTAMLEMNMDKAGVEELSKRSRGTPRILNRLLRRVRDFAQVQNQKIISPSLIDYALTKMNIDALGLDDMDRKILNIVINHFNGGPVGIENLATSLSEDTATIEDIYEPYLIQLGFIKRTRQGRVATSHAFKYLGIKAPHPDNKQEQSLFDNNTS